MIQQRYCFNGFISCFIPCDNFQLRLGKLCGIAERKRCFHHSVRKNILLLRQNVFPVDLKEIVRVKHHCRRGCVNADYILNNNAVAVLINCMEFDRIIAVRKGNALHNFGALILKFVPVSVSGLRIDIQLSAYRNIGFHSDCTGCFIILKLYHRLR